MSQKNVWEILEIPVTADVSQIRQAYAAKAKEVHPEEHPEAFMELQNAFQKALHFAKKQSHNQQNQTMQPLSSQPSKEVDSPSSITQEIVLEAPAAHTVHEQSKTGNPLNHDKEAIKMQRYFSQSDERYRQNQQETIKQTISRIETLFHQTKAADQEWKALFAQQKIRDIAVHEDFITALYSTMQHAAPIPLHAIMALSFFYQELQDSLYDDPIPFSILLSELDRQSQIHSDEAQMHKIQTLRNLFLLFLLALSVSIFCQQLFFIGVYGFAVMLFTYFHSAPKIKNRKQILSHLPWRLISLAAFLMVIIIFGTLLLSLWS